MSQFVQVPILKKFRVKGHNIELKLEPGVFCPSTHGSLIGEYIGLSSGETVLDMGTGSGILGIIAAKEGGFVDCSDTSESAVKLALENARRNDVSMNGYVGEYFCTPKSKYDYIIANLPQEVLPQNYANQLGQLEQAISGGATGNIHLLKFLEQAHKHMHSHSRALIAVYSISDYISTLNQLKVSYYPKLLDVITSPAKDFVQENPDAYDAKMRTGEIGLFRKNGLMQASIFFYELRKK